MPIVPDFVLKIPSKAFIAGEYIATQGFPSLVYTGSPYFEFHISADNNSEKNFSTVESVFHPDSPAGKLAQKNILVLQKYSFQFIDPYTGAGGWGASTAQFLGLYTFLEFLKSQVVSVDEFNIKALDLRSLLDTYWHYSWNNQGLRPSGADLIAQLRGQICLIEHSSGKINQLSWPFDDYEIIFFATGNKVTTHTHLQSLDQINLINLQDSMSLIIEGWETANVILFAEGLTLYQEHLEDLELVHPQTKELVKQLVSDDKIITSKGCGALGADIILVLCKKEDTTAVLSLLTKFKHIKFISKPAYGLEMTTNFKENRANVESQP